MKHVIHVNLSQIRSAVPEISNEKPVFVCDDLDLQLQTRPSEGPNTSSVCICCKSVKWFPRYLIHKQKSHRQCEKHNFMQFTACGNNQQASKQCHWHYEIEQLSLNLLLHAPISDQIMIEPGISLTFCVRFLLPERHQWKPTVQAAAVMLRTSTVDGQSPASQQRNFKNAPRHPPVSGQQRAQTSSSVRTMSSYRGMDASSCN